MLTLPLYLCLVYNFNCCHFFFKFYQSSENKSEYVSAYKLQIERGRYLDKNVEERKCTDCNVIEDEIHFFCDCHKYNNSREKLYLELGNQHFFLRTTVKRVWMGGPANQ